MAFTSAWSGAACASIQLESLHREAFTAGGGMSQPSGVFSTNDLSQFVISSPPNMGQGGDSFVQSGLIQSSDSLRIWAWQAGSDVHSNSSSYAVARVTFTLTEPAIVQAWMVEYIDTPGLVISSLTIRDAAGNLMVPAGPIPSPSPRFFYAPSGTYEAAYFVQAGPGLSASVVWDCVLSIPSPACAQLLVAAALPVTRRPRRVTPHSVLL